MPHIVIVASLRLLIWCTARIHASNIGNDRKHSPKVKYLVLASLYLIQKPRFNVTCEGPGKVSIMDTGVPACKGIASEPRKNCYTHVCWAIHHEHIDRPSSTDLWEVYGVNDLGFKLGPVVHTYMLQTLPWSCQQTSGSSDAADLVRLRS